MSQENPNEQEVEATEAEATENEETATPETEAEASEAEAEEEEEEEKVSKKKKKISFENQMPIDEAIAYFEAIIAGFKKGAVHFRRGDDSMVLEPGAFVDVEVEAVDKGKRQKIEFEISWAPSEDSDFEIN